MTTTKPTRTEVLDIIETYDEMLRRHWSEALLAQRTKWCTILALLPKESP